MGRHFSLNLYMPATPRRKAAGWRKVVDRGLRLIGITWRASPLRRIIQTICLATYLWLFLWVAWPYAEVIGEKTFASREKIPAEIFLWLDPLVGLSTAIAARLWNVALWGMLAILAIGLLFPRGFCGYICPLGTLIDCFDWAIGRHVRRLHIVNIGRWAHTRYYILAAVLLGSIFGAMLAGHVAAIPVLTRGLTFTLGRWQAGLGKTWSVVWPAGTGVWIAVALFGCVFLLSLLGKRFWCRYVCPSGGLLSVFNLLCIGQRKVESTCIGCNKCVEVCPFDAIKEDFTTRSAECTFCQTCGGACPIHAIQFVTRWTLLNLKPENDPPVAARDLSRRGFVAAAIGGTFAAGITREWGKRKKLLRPPGSVDEEHFLDLCIRCDECLKVCPGGVLQPAGMQGGLEALWTPIAVPTHAGCHQDCNYCTQVCPTHAIVPLTIERKRRFKMGLAVIDHGICLPHRGERDCQLCYDECEAAGYHAIRMESIRLKVGDVPEGVMSQEEIEQMGRILAPMVDAHACVGCGLCEYRCHAALVKQEKVLKRRAIEVIP